MCFAQSRKVVVDFLLCFIVCTIFEFAASQEARPSPYYSLLTSNIRRCGKLCERQGKCAAVTFDIRTGMCYLFEASVEIPSDRAENGRFLSVNYPQNVDHHDSRQICEKETQLIVPSALHKDGSCLSFQGLRSGELCCDVCQYKGTHDCSSRLWWCIRTYVRNSKKVCVKAVMVKLQSVGQKTEVYINKKDIGSRRGLNILVFNGSTGVHETGDAFDTHSIENMSDKAMDYLQKIEDGKLVVLFSKDEMAWHLTVELRKFLNSKYSSVYIEDLAHRDVWFLVARQGGETLFEGVSKKTGSGNWPDQLRLVFQLYKESGIVAFQIIDA